MTSPTESNNLLRLQGAAKRFAHSLKITESGNLAEDLANRYRLLLDTSSFPISYLDADGQFLFIGRHGAENLGDTPENIVGKTVHDFFPPEDAARYIERFREVIETQQERIYEDCVQLNTGERWFLSVLHPLNATDGTPLGVQIVSHDVTEKKRVEQALEESRKFSQAVTDASPHIVYVLDLSEMRIVYASPQLEYDLGKTPAEVCNLDSQSVLEFLNREDFVSLSEADQRQRMPEEDADERLIRLKHANGSWRWFATRERVFQRNPDDTPKQLLGTMRNVTAQREAEEEVQQHREKLIHVGRLNTMGEMVAGIAHELAQPLYSILNYAKASQNVLSSYDTPDLCETHEWLEKIEQAASRAGDIIRQFRTFAQRGTALRELNDIRDIVQDAIDLLGYEFGQHKIQLNTELGKRPLIAKVDRVQILQTCVNLLQNAMEAIGDMPQEMRCITIRAGKANGLITVSIADRGKGLPDDVTNLFESFVTTKPDGLGLGLAICKTILEQHDGSIQAERNPAGGATLSFVLPISKESQ